MRFIDEDGDTKRVFSKECFDKWVVTRKEPPKQPEESFRRVLTAHICGVDGRRPFPPKIEANLLQILRKKEVWECFRGTKVSIGIRGFRNYGYHETKGMKLAHQNAQDDISRKRKRREDDEEVATKLLRTGLLPYFAGAVVDPFQSMIHAQMQLRAQQLQHLQSPVNGVCTPLMQYAQTQQHPLSLTSLHSPQAAYSKQLLPQYLSPLPQLHPGYNALNGMQTPLMGPNALLLSQATTGQGPV